jgi:hypothetical protein
MGNLEIGVLTGGGAEFYDIFGNRIEKKRRI